MYKNVNEKKGGKLHVLKVTWKCCVKSYFPAFEVISKLGKRNMIIKL